ncbi:MAG: family peptidase [Chitinophagaceae bacterium]|nr:family peptidase [Chitinophagaceae bacterium]
MKTIFSGPKSIIILLFIIPVISFSQSKKQKKAQEKADNETISNLTAHVQYLASDKLEGRRTGTPGELLAMQYIAAKFKQYGLEPKGSAGFVQAFVIDEGKQADTVKTYFLLNEKKLELNSDFFPLPYSPSTAITSHASPSLSEKGEAWFWDVKDVVEDNLNNPHFDIFETINAQVKKIVAKGAKALIIYNTSAKPDNVQFNKFDTSATSAIPVFYVTQAAAKKYLSDATATYDINLAATINKKNRTGHNVIGFINNSAPTTIILGAHYDHLGYGEDNNALDGFGEIHNGADDNSSGTSALIELARLLKTQSSKTNNYLFIAFSGEELGLFGSKYWLQHPTVSIIPN